MKKLFCMAALLLCLTACSSRVDLMPQASPQTSALCLTVYDGETITRQHLFETDIVRAKALADFQNAKAEPADVDLTTLQPPFYGLEMGGTDSDSVYGLWSDGYFIRGDGTAYTFDYDFEAFRQQYKFEEPEKFSALTLLPCVHYLAKSETGWNTAVLTPSDHIEADPSVTVELIEQTETHLVLEFTNAAEEEWGYGHAFYLETQVDGHWYRIPAEQDVVFTEELMIVMPGATAQERCWIEPYGMLPAGRYRLILQEIAVEFSVE